MNMCESLNSDAKIMSFYFFKEPVFTQLRSEKHQGDIKLQYIYPP